MLVPEPAAALPLKAERVFIAGLFQHAPRLGALCRGIHSLPFQPSAGLAQRLVMHPGLDGSYLHGPPR